MLDVLTFEAEVREQSDIVRAFFTLGQGRKDQKTSPATAIFAHPGTLDADGDGVEITLSNATGFYDTNGAYPSKNKQNEREDNAACKNPLRDVEWNSWLYLACPSRKSE